MTPRRAALFSVLFVPFAVAAGLRVGRAQQALPPLAPAIVPVKTPEADRRGRLYPERGRPENGAIIVARGTPAGVGACAQCHAFNGASDGSGAFPRLSGQSEHYLLKQLRDYTTDRRRNAIMTPFAKALTDQEKADVAAYFAAQSAAPLPPPLPVTADNDAERAARARGQLIATVGNGAAAVQSCANCHGAQGTGESPTVPYLQGQYASYIEAQFQAWNKGYRQNSGGASMHEIAHKLPESDVRAVAKFYEQLRLAGPDADENLPAALEQAARGAASALNPVPNDGVPNGKAALPR